NAPLHVQIFDMMGNKVMSETFTGAGSINLEGFVKAQGTYFAKVRVGNATQSFKFTTTSDFNASWGANAVKKTLLKVGESDKIQVTAAGYDTMVVDIPNLIDTTIAVYLFKTKPAAGPQYSFGWGLKNEPVPSRGCGKDAPNIDFKDRGGGKKYWEYKWSKGTRTVRIDIPSDYDKNKPYRLVFGMQCMGGWAGGVQDEGYYGMKPFDTENSTIFIAPEGNGNQAPWDQNDYILFDELLDFMESNYCIDSSRVFSSGFSYGSMFTNGLSRDRQAKLRAVAVYETADVNIWLPEPKNLPIAWMGVHGMSDGLCTPAMGRSARNLALQHNSAEGKDATKENAQESNGGQHTCYDYKDVDQRFPVKWCTDNAGHVWDHIDPGQQQSWVPKTTWEFFTQF
ncbi:MAG: T9SS type A sorting domain-containing protein, partial [Fibrobacteraceae bacterium]|nr:T9SS type A sorting domain-containing protein [Fibrobacteraceae bacterium]